MMPEADEGTRNLAIGSSCILAHGVSLFNAAFSKCPLEDREQGDSSDCERSKKLHDPL